MPPPAIRLYHLQRAVLQMCMEHFLKEIDGSRGATRRSLIGWIRDAGVGSCRFRLERAIEEGTAPHDAIAGLMIEIREFGRMLQDLESDVELVACVEAALQNCVGAIPPQDKIAHWIATCGDCGGKLSNKEAVVRFNERMGKTWDDKRFSKAKASLTGGRPQSKGDTALMLRFIEGL